jgi:plasmid maintenance system killer protein
VQPNVFSLNSALCGGLLEIAETVILPSLSRRNIQPYEDINRVKDFMDHQRSKGNINSLENYLFKMTNPVNDELKSESLRSVIENHFSPLKNKKKPRPNQYSITI